MSHEGGQKSVTRYLSGNLYSNNQQVSCLLKSSKQWINSNSNNLSSTEVLMMISRPKWCHYHQQKIEEFCTLRQFNENVQDEICLHLILSLSLSLSLCFIVHHHCQVLLMNHVFKWVIFNGRSSMTSAIFRDRSSIHRNWRDPRKVPFK